MLLSMTRERFNINLLEQKGSELCYGQAETLKQILETFTNK